MARTPTEADEADEADEQTDATGWECSKCGGVLAKDADECPNCGANPMTRSTADGIAAWGVAISCTIVLAPIGIPLALIGFFARFGLPKRLAVESSDDAASGADE